MLYELRDVDLELFGSLMLSEKDFNGGIPDDGDGDIRTHELIRGVGELHGELIITSVWRVYLSYHHAKIRWIELCNACPHKIPGKNLVF